MDNLLPQALLLLQDDWVIYALPLFFAALLIEWSFACRKSLALYERQDFLASMGVMLLTVVVDVLPKLGGVLLMFVCWELSPLKEVVSRAPHWWVLLFFLDDLTYYSFHRANHEVRFLWAGHASHHNSQYYNYGTALRQGILAPGQRKNLSELGFKALIAGSIVSLMSATIAGAIMG